MTKDFNRIPSAEEIAQINAVHFVKTRLHSADLLFVFGTRIGVDERIATACRLWRDGLFTWTIVSGGVTPGSDFSECAIIKAGMVAGGVPAEIILEEHQAKNTGENVIFSLPVIDAKVGLANIRSVICLGHLATSRRYPMTLHRYWPNVEKMLVVDNVYGVPEAQWPAHEPFRRHVLREWDKIIPYLAKGFIAQWPD